MSAANRTLARSRRLLPVIGHLVISFRQELARSPPPPQHSLLAWRSGRDNSLPGVNIQSLLRRAVSGDHIALTEAVFTRAAVDGDGEPRGFPPNAELFRLLRLLC
jgi:hypothetical protein